LCIPQVPTAEQDNIT